MFSGIVFYIHQNPVVSGFVYETEQWVYSSAKHFAKNDGIIKLAEFCQRKSYFEESPRHKVSQRTLPTLHPCANVS